MELIKKWLIICFWYFMVNCIVVFIFWFLNSLFYYEYYCCDGGGFLGWFGWLRRLLILICGWFFWDCFFCGCGWEGFVEGLRFNGGSWYFCIWGGWFDGGWILFLGIW